MPAFRLERLDHVSLNVGDRARSVAWYQRILGLELRSDPDVDPSEPVFLGDFGRCIALFQAATEAPARDYESIGLRHVAFMLGKDGLARAQTHLRAQSVDFRFEDHGSAHSVYLRDPDGNTVELTTYEV